MDAIAINGLGKAFKKYSSRWQRLRDWLLPLGQKRYEQSWVLRDINLVVGQGEALALVGMNGAGKSTLLKLIAGTLQPTTGSITVRGHLAALLELGIGFHPDFTGRQNVVMAGQLLGLKANEIEELMPEIEAFSEIGEYIDQPVRVYSSGMQVRLAFSVATARRPDILIVDEALSVGDAHFQHKSFERIKQYREQGTTLIIVSHDKNAIQSICDRVILLDRGCILEQGAPELMFELYNALIAKADQAQAIQTVSTSDGKVAVASGTGGARVALLKLTEQPGGQEVSVINVGAHTKIIVEIDVLEDIPCLVFGFSIRNRLGQVMYGTNTHFTAQQIFNAKAGDQHRLDIDFVMNLGPGSYSISTALVGSDTHLDHNYEWRDRVSTFEVINATTRFFEGQTYLAPTIRVQ